MMVSDAAAGDLIQRHRAEFTVDPQPFYSAAIRLDPRAAYYVARAHIRTDLAAIKRDHRAGSGRVRGGGRVALGAVGMDQIGQPAVGGDSGDASAELALAPLR